VTEQPAAAGEPTASRRPGDAQTWEVADCFFELIGNLASRAENLAQRLGVPVPFIKALHTMDCPMAMKELGKRMHCDPSFVTLMADMLEKRGLARREPHPADRRVKNLVLTDDGEALKQRVEAELSAEMPWNQALNTEERAQLLALIRKMLAAGGPAPGGADAARLHTSGQLTDLLVSALQESVQHASTTNPPAQTGEVTADVSETSVAS
jgi:DNA-binding MarR family transcriptional regulator